MLGKPLIGKALSQCFAGVTQAGRPTPLRAPHDEQEEKKHDSRPVVHTKTRDGRECYTLGAKQRTQLAGLLVPRPPN